MPTRKAMGCRLRVSLAALLGLTLLAGCAGVTATASRSDDFIEIANPAFTMSPGSPETIWVPRSYVQKGIPRGTELAKQGYRAVQDAVAPAAAAPAPGPHPAAPGAGPETPPQGSPAAPAGQGAPAAPAPPPKAPRQPAAATWI